MSEPWRQGADVGLEKGGLAEPDLDFGAEDGYDALPEGWGYQDGVLVDENGMPVPGQMLPDGSPVTAWEDLSDQERDQITREQNASRSRRP
jgi:hypothetical protein